MIKRYFYIFSASLFILLTSTTGVKADFNDDKLETLARQTNSPPDGINYQAVLRDNNGDILANSAVTMRFTLSDANGDVYIETHTVTTNANGMISLVIGKGTQTGGSKVYPVIDWSIPISVKVEADSGAGFVDLGTNDLQSVPYANFASNGITGAQATEITANTAKNGITPAQAAEIEANTLKGGVTPEQAIVLANTTGTNTGDQDISGIVTNETAIALNTVKTGITLAQAAEIEANTLKGGVTPEQATVLANTSGTNTGDQDISGIATNATAIALNTAKVGITPAQASEITTNTAKAGLTPAEATVVANTSGTNTGDQDISGIATNATAITTNETAIALNTAKTGITSAQAAEITANTAKASGAFANTANVIFAGDVDDDFLFGSTQLIDAGNAAEDRRMYFDKSKGAFRVGGATGTEWDVPGSYSFAAGLNNKADGSYSTIGGGYGNDASGDNSTVSGGSGNKANSTNSTVGGGSSNYANGTNSTVGGGSGNYAYGTNTTIGGGINNLAKSSYSTIGGGLSNYANSNSSTVSGGYDNNAYGSYSTVGGGNSNFSSGTNSTIGGGYYNASAGDNAAVAGGYKNSASGSFSSVSGGKNVKAQAFGEFATGTYSADAASADATSIIPTDRLFTLGNGTGVGSESNAMVILKNGNTTINGQLTLSDGASNSFTLPNIDGTAGQVLQTDGAGAVTWQTASGGGGSYAGNGTDAFVAGNASNLADGNYSTVSGGFTNKTIAGGKGGAHFSTIGGGNTNTIGGGKGGGSFATISGGTTNTISGNGSFIGGGKNNTTNYATYATTVGGAYNDASGNYSTIGGGSSNYAGGVNATVPGGTGLFANSFGETAIGVFNVNQAAINPSAFDANDQLLVVGNGTADAARSNAMTILKNGNTDINGNLVANSLGVDGVFTLPTTDGTAGQVLKTDGAGAVTWQVGGAFINTANVIFAGDIDDDFLFGSTQLADAGNVAEDNRMFFDKSKGAFRVGGATGVAWDVSGNYSFAAGQDNGAFGAHSTVAGGHKNAANSPLSFIGGGYDNIVTGSGGSILAGRGNRVKVPYGSIAGGKNNYIGGAYSSIGGGYMNSTSISSYSTIAGGSNNTTSNYYATIAGGSGNRAQGRRSAVGGGNQNDASGSSSTIGGGDQNVAVSKLSFIGGGYKNFTTGYSSVISGGRENKVIASYTTIAGGRGNYVSGAYSAIGGGYLNSTSISSYSTIAGGKNNTTSNYFATIAGGSANTASGRRSTIGGGNQNIASGENSAVGGGNSVNAQSQSEFAVGQFSLDAASADPINFVTTDRLFTIGNGTADAARSNALVILKNGNATLAGTLTQNSDRRLKRDIAPLGSTLAKVNEMEGVTYKWNNLTPRDTTEANIGLIAQEVEALFPELVKTGDNGYKSVNYIQLVPVLIEAIKELSKENDALETANANMEIRQQGDDQKFAALEGKLDYLMQMMTVEASAGAVGND